MSSARPSSRSPSRWRWTAASSRSMGQMYNCPDALQRRALHDQRHAPVRPALLGRRDHEGKLQHRHRPDRRRRSGATRQQAFLEKMGFLDRSQIELGERGRTLTPGANWGQIATMTVGYGHGIAVTPLHLASGYATLFNGGVYRPATLLKVDRNHPVGEGPRACSARRPATRCGRCCGWSSPRAPARRPTRRAIASAARPARPRSARRPLYVVAVVTTLRRRFPDGRTALCDRRHARRPQGHRRNLSASTPPAGTSRRWSAGPSAGSRRCSASGPTSAASRTWPKCCRSFTKKRSTNPVRLRRPRGRSIAIPKSPALPSTIARSRAAACSARSGARCSTARISSARRCGAARSRWSRGPSAKVEGVPHLADAEPRAAVRASSPPNFSRPIRRRSSRSPAPTARPRRSR